MVGSVRREIAGYGVTSTYEQGPFLREMYEGREMVDVGWCSEYILSLDSFPLLFP